MKTKAVRMYGKNDLRLEEFELPTIKDDEILAHIICDSVCMSTYKELNQGAEHKRVPEDIAEKPVIIGHEFCGEILEVGKKWADKFKKGQKFSIQPNLNYNGTLYSPGYSYQYIGGDATYIVIPNEVMEMNCLLKYDNDTFFYGSVAEPMSCIVGTYHAMYHTKAGIYEHYMGIVEGGNLAILAGVGPMGIGAIDYAIHCDRKPSLLVVTDIDDARIERAASIYTVEEAARNGVKLVYVNTATMDNAEEYIKSLTGGKGFDDILVFAPVRSVVEMADRLLGHDGCLNFFAGPNNPKFAAEMNFYDVHYAAHHIVGTSGGNTDDMIESLDMMSSGKLNTASMITHIGGLNAVIDTVANLPNIKGGKKLIYTNIKLPLTAIADFEAEGETNPMFKKLAEICARNNQLWNPEAEKYLLENAESI